MFLWRTHTLVPLFPSCTLYRSFTLNLACQHHNTIPSGTFLCKYFCMHAFFKKFYYVCISSAVCVCVRLKCTAAHSSLWCHFLSSPQSCVFFSPPVSSSPTHHLKAAGSRISLWRLPLRRLSLENLAVQVIRRGCCPRFGCTLAACRV